MNNQADESGERVNFRPFPLAKQAKPVFTGEITSVPLEQPNIEPDKQDKTLA